MPRISLSRREDLETLRSVFDGARWFMRATGNKQQWLNDLPYGVIHRLASDGTLPKVADICIDWCFAACPNLRVDTHNDNTVMQNILRRKGFVGCGMVFVEDGTPRIAFQKTR